MGNLDDLRGVINPGAFRRVCRGEDLRANEVLYVGARGRIGHGIKFLELGSGDRRRREQLIDDLKQARALCPAEFA